MKITLEEIEEVINRLSTAVTYAKQARHIAKKVYGSDTEVGGNLKYTYEEIKNTARILESAN